VGALTIAFDTIIVGALALPWVFIIVHIFYFEGENRLADLLNLVNRKKLQAAAGVLLFAATYTVGSAVSRIARDFFNDDDLHLSDVSLRLPFHKHLIVRSGVTEDRILARVYCGTEGYFPTENGTPLATEILDFKSHDSVCWQTLRWMVRLNKDQVENDEDLNDAAEDIFGFEEAALLLKGEDDTLRLRQLHDQVMVLRGAAFNGMIAFSLCVFAWRATLKREEKVSWLRNTLAVLPILYIGSGMIAIYHHLLERAPSDPPYMEFTLLLLGAVGAFLTWGKTWLQQPEQVLTSCKPAEKARKHCWKKEEWSRLSLVAFVLTAAAFLGWWATEVTYTQEVIYSYSSPVMTSQK
jgi:hypothetical protein